MSRLPRRHQKGDLLRCPRMPQHERIPSAECHLQFLLGELLSWHQENTQSMSAGNREKLLMFSLGINGSSTAFCPACSPV